MTINNLIDFILMSYFEGLVFSSFLTTKHFNCLEQYKYNGIKNLKNKTIYYISSHGSECQTYYL